VRYKGQEITKEGQTERAVSGKIIALWRNYTYGNVEQPGGGPGGGERRTDRVTTVTWTTGSLLRTRETMQERKKRRGERKDEGIRASIWVTALGFRGPGSKPRSKKEKEKKEKKRVEEGRGKRREGKGRHDERFA